MLADDYGQQKGQYAGNAWIFRMTMDGYGAGFGGRPDLHKLLQTHLITLSTAMKGQSI